MTDRECVVNSRKKIVNSQKLRDRSYECMVNDSEIKANSRKRKSIHSELVTDNKFDKKILNQ